MDKHICKAKVTYSPWDKKPGDWVYGYYVALPDEYTYGKDICHAIFSLDCEHICMGEYKDWGWHEVNPDTVCRCTGWHDSYKIPIFERDVVEFTIGSCKDRHLIWWNNEMSMLTAVPLDGVEFNGYDYWNGKYPQFEYSTFCFMMQDPYGDFSDIKVIGNIVDNTELMEGIK